MESWWQSRRGRVSAGEVLRGWLGRAFVAFGLVFCVATLVASVSGCARPLTQADLDRNGTRVYATRNRVELLKAGAIALRTLGYDVVVNDAQAGRIKTAPKVVQVAAVGGNYSAVAISDALAWTLEVRPQNGGVVVGAVPRVSRNGAPLEMEDVHADYMERAFAQLWAEIDSNLSGAPTKPTSARVR